MTGHENFGNNYIDRKQTTPERIMRLKLLDVMVDVAKKKIAASKDQEEIDHLLNSIDKIKEGTDFILLNTEVDQEIDFCNQILAKIKSFKEKIKNN